MVASWPRILPPSAPASIRLFALSGTRWGLQVPNTGHSRLKSALCSAPNSQNTRFLGAEAEKTRAVSTHSTVQKKINQKITPKCTKCLVEAGAEPQHHTTHHHPPSSTTTNGLVRSHPSCHTPPTHPSVRFHPCHSIHTDPPSKL